jgi:predicted DNA-binding transcriptional regulator AlpA
MTKTKEKTTKENDEQLLTETEAAKLLGLKNQTLALWRCRRKGPKYVKMTKGVRYFLSDIHAWLRQRIVVPARR